MHCNVDSLQVNCAGVCVRMLNHCNTTVTHGCCILFSRLSDILATLLGNFNMFLCLCLKSIKLEDVLVGKEI